MLKHPALTLRRINTTVQQCLKDRILGEEAPLQIEVCPVAHENEADARAKGPWETITTGYEYGPAYRMLWFRVTGTIPKDWDGREVAMIAELGGERTVWKDNCPERGIDEPHALYRLADAATGGAKIDLCIQAYTMNQDLRLIGTAPARRAITDTVKKVALVTVNTARQELLYDMAFGLSLLETLRDTDPNYAALLRGLNAVCNTLEMETDDAIPLCRKIVKDTLGSLTGEIKHTITACGHAHLDTAWLWPLQITHYKMAHTAANQLYLMDRYKRYVFSHSQASQYEWVEEEYPQLFERIKSAARRGQWEVVGSMWVEADCNLTGGESLIRQFLYGRRYFKKHFGTTCDDMWLPDVFGYSAALPQILAKFGIKYFLTQKISWNQINKFPHNTFWWQGIDGTKIWSHFPPADTYIGDCTPKQLVDSVHQHKDQGRSDQSLYLFGWGDGGGGPTEQHLEFLNRAVMAPCLPEIEIGKRAVDFFADAKAKGRDLMTWTGELYLEMHRGTYTSQAYNKWANRTSEFLLRDAEWLSSFGTDYPSKYPSADLEKAWKLVLLNQFHDIIPGSSVTEVYTDSRRDYGVVFEIAEGIIEAKLKEIGGKLNTEEMEHPVALFANASMTSQGALAWDDEDVPGSLAIAGRNEPVQLIEEFGEKKLIFAVPEEALGTVAVADLSETPANIRPRVKARDRRLENGYWSVKFDSNGNITSLTSIDDRTTEFIAPGKLANVFQLFDDRPNFWGAWDIDPFVYEKAQTLLKCDSFEVVERGPVRVAVEIVRSFGNSTIRQRISLGPTPGVRFDTEIDWREDHKLLKVAFPVNVNAMRATYEIQYGHVERPTHYNTSWDMARFEVPAQKWADISQGDLGVALINDCKYGYDCFGSTLRLTLLRAPKAPDEHCDMGLHRFSYVLLPHFDQMVHSDVVAAAYAVNSPVRAAHLEPGKGASTPLPKLVTVDSRNVVIESVKKAEDSANLIVRLYECHNTRGKTWVSCAVPVRRAWLVDLNEDVLQQLDLSDGQVEVEYNPFEIVTLMLEI